MSPSLFSGLPLGIGRATLHLSDIHGLATHNAYGIPHCCDIRWALTSPFHPYSGKPERLFSVTL